MESPEGRLLWKIEILSSEEDHKPETQADIIRQIEQRYHPQYFHSIKVYLSLAVIIHEFRVRAAVMRARLEEPGRICVCDRIRGEENELLWDMATENVP